MPSPLGYRIVTALKTVVTTLTAAAKADFKTAQIYARETIDFDPARDVAAGSAAVVIAKTPDQPIVRRKKLSCREVEYPLSVVLFDAGDAAAKQGPEWRDTWRDSVGDTLDGVKLAGVAEVIRVWNDDSVVLDLSAWEIAKLFVAPINLRVLCRLPVRSP